MIRHGLPRTTVAPTASWPTRILTPAPQSGCRLVSQSAKSELIGHLKLLETIASGAMTTMPVYLRQPAGTIPNLIYP
jgi:hypothetical protein